MLCGSGDGSGNAGASDGGGNDNSGDGGDESGGDDYDMSDNVEGSGEGGND